MPALLCESGMTPFAERRCLVVYSHAAFNASLRLAVIAWSSISGPMG